MSAGRVCVYFAHHCISNIQMNANVYLAKSSSLFPAKKESISQNYVGLGDQW